LIRVEIHIDLLLESFLDVNLGEDPKTLCFEGFQYFGFFFFQVPFILIFIP
jgi:hypothetical protein